MSSSPKKPYKSKLLNLLNRYYIKLNSSLGVKVRELGYNIQGGLQKLVLPFWQIWQSTNKRAKFGASNSDASLPQAKDSQTPKISRVDYLIRAVNHNLSKHPSYSSLLPPNFTGLASRLKDKDIIAIVNFNQIQNLDQKIDQDYLKFTIDYTLENPRASGLKNNFFSEYVLKIKSILPKFKARQKQYQFGIEKNNLLTQREVNDHHNSAFLKEKITKNLSASELKGSEILSAIESELIDIEEQADNNNRHLLKVESKKLKPLLQKNNKSTQSVTPKLLSVAKKPQFNLPPINNELVKQVITTSNEKIKKVLPVISKNTSQIVAKSIDKIQLTTSNINKSIDEDPFQVKVLIIEALNYFFTQQKNVQNKLLKSSTNHRSLPKITQTKTNIINKEDVEQPWLSWSDLYGNHQSLPVENIKPVSNQTDAISSTDKIINNTEQALSLPTNTQNIEDINNQNITISTTDNDSNLTNKTASSSINKSKARSIKLTHQITKTKQISESIVKNKIGQVENKVDRSDNNPILTTTNSLHLINTENEKSQVNKVDNHEKLIPKTSTKVTEKTNNKTPQQLEAIEVKVVEIKYEKHLLEIILEKLDQIILWLEETLVRVIAIIKILISNISKQ